MQNYQLNQKLGLLQENFDTPVNTNVCAKFLKIKCVRAAITYCGCDQIIATVKLQDTMCNFSALEYCNIELKIISTKVHGEYLTIKAQTASLQT